MARRGERVHIHFGEHAGKFGTYVYGVEEENGTAIIKTDSSGIVIVPIKYLNPEGENPVPPSQGKAAEHSLPPMPLSQPILMQRPDPSNVPMNTSQPTPIPKLSTMAQSSNGISTSPLGWSGISTLQTQNTFSPH